VIDHGDVAQRAAERGRVLHVADGDLDARELERSGVRAVADERAHAGAATDE